MRRRPVHTNGTNRNVPPRNCGATKRPSTTNAAATPYTLKLMTIVAAVFTPIVVGYQAWTYWIFRKRISIHHIPAAH